MDAIDVVFDTVCGDTFERPFSTLRRSGTMVMVAAFPNDQGERFGVSATRVVTHVNAVLPFKEVRQALTKSQEGRSRGKIVLSMET